VTSGAEVRSRSRRGRLCRAAVGALCGLLLWAPAAAEPPSGEEIARRINARPRATQVSRLATLTLIDPDGRRRERKLLAFWKDRADARWLVFFALEPPDLEHEAFLAHDHFDAGRPDDQWYYRPARKRARRLPALSRSESFLGSEFTLEDVKKQERVELGDFRWKNLGRAELDGRDHWRIEQVPISPDVAAQLGHGRVESFVDPVTWMRRRIVFYDRDGALLKTFEIEGAEQVAGYWTARRIVATNHRNRRGSTLAFSKIDTTSPLDDGLFSTRTLESEPGRRLLRRLDRAHHEPVTGGSRLADSRGGREASRRP
jgi:hypothetical protein